MIDDHSGDFALIVKPKTLGYETAIAEINAAGGVLGRQLEMVFYDGQSDVKRHQELAQKCILDDEVDVIMAGATSSAREAARAVAVENEVIYWHNNQGEGGIADKHSFFTGPIPEQQILTGVSYMIEKYGPRMYILAADYGFGQVSALWTHAAAGLYGGEVVGEEFIPLGNSDFAATIANIQKAKPDFGVFYLVGGAQYNYYPQAAAAGANIPAVSTVNVQQGYEHKRLPAARSGRHVHPLRLRRGDADGFGARIRGEGAGDQPGRALHQPDDALRLRRDPHDGAGVGAGRDDRDRRHHRGTGIGALVRCA